MKRVLVDCDGVLADFIGGFLRLVNDHFGTSHVPSDITGFDITESLGWSFDRGMEAYRLISDCAEFARNLDVLSGSVDGMRRLRGIADVYIVTSPWWSHPTWMRDRNDWLHRHFEIKANKVVHTAAKHICTGDVLVDDKTSTLVEWRDCNRGVAVQWMTVHNRLDNWKGISTCDWNELCDIVEELA